MHYQTIQELLTAKEAGQLPEDFVLMIDNDAVYGYIKDESVFDMEPRALIEALLTIVGFNWTHA